MKIQFSVTAGVHRFRRTRSMKNHFIVTAGESLEELGV